MRIRLHSSVRATVDLATQISSRTQRNIGSGMPPWLPTTLNGTPDMRFCSRTRWFPLVSRLHGLCIASGGGFVAAGASKSAWKKQYRSSWWPGSALWTALSTFCASLPLSLLTMSESTLCEAGRAPPVPGVDGAVLSLTASCARSELACRAVSRRASLASALRSKRCLGMMVSGDLCSVVVWAARLACGVARSCSAWRGAARGRGPPRSVERSSSELSEKPLSLPSSSEAAISLPRLGGVCGLPSGDEAMRLLRTRSCDALQMMKQRVCVCGSGSAEVSQY